MARHLVVVVMLVAACGEPAPEEPPISEPIVDAPTPPTRCGERASVSAGVCDVLTQAPCATNEKCTWIVELRDNPLTDENEPDVGRFGCTCAGSIDVGEVCTVSGPAFPADPYPQAGMGAGVADECVRGAYCRDEADGRGRCREICDARPTPASTSRCDESFSCGRVANTFLLDATIVAGICEPMCDPVTQRTLATGDEACSSPDPAAPTIGCYPQGSAMAPDNFACTRVPRGAKGKKDGAQSYGPTDSAGVQTGSYSNGCEAGYRAAYLFEGSTTIAECNGTCAPKDSDSSTPAMRAAAVGDPTKPGKFESDPAPVVGHALCIDGNKGSARASDCRYQWFLDRDEDGALLGETQFSDTTGVCFPYSRLKIDPDGAGPMAPVDHPSCAQMAKYDEPPEAPFDFTAADAGCYSLAFTSTLPEPIRQRILTNAAKLPRLHFPTAEGRTVARHLLR